MRWYSCAVAARYFVMVVCGGSVALGGSLTPPVGPVGPTFKTLGETEPRIAVNAVNTPGDADSLFKITQPGSYYLTGNITGVAAKHGIEIAASGVTVDLMGFDLMGVAGSLDGVSATLAGLTNIAVISGSVRNWGVDGIDLGAINGRVESVLATLNVGDGISVGLASTITDCSASNNSGAGIFIGSHGTITNCSAYDNTGNGIITGSGCTVTNCSGNFNTGDGINVGSGSIVENCVAHANTADGIQCNNSCLIRGNTCSSNGLGAGDGAGIHAASSDSRIEGNNCISADRGIDVDIAGNVIIKNTCSGNSVNWDIVVGNAVAPIVLAATNAAAITGSTYAGSLGSTDPNANFTY